MENIQTNWVICPECQGRGKKSQRLSKKIRLEYQKSLEQFEKTGEGTAPIRPKSTFSICSKCSGSGLIPSSDRPLADLENLPHIAIIGGGIGGVALAVACLHRKIPFTLYERDNHFEERSQGYGLTLQQAVKLLKDLEFFHYKTELFLQDILFILLKEKLLENGEFENGCNLI